MSVMPKMMMPTIRRASHFRTSSQRLEVLITNLIERSYFNKLSIKHNTNKMTGEDRRPPNQITIRSYL